VYPGFFPGFVFNGICANHPTQFTDTTRTNYGVVDSWSWNFGAPPLNDTSHLQNPTYTYLTPGTYNVLFIVTNSKGCVDTVNKDIDILDKPPLTINPRDTLICLSDQVQLQAIGSGTFTWTGPNISNATVANPVVSPSTTTWYHVQLNQNGCLNNDSALVRVVDHVDISVRSDTTICKGDAVQLSAQTNGLHFTWTPAAILNNSNILNPVATVNANTNFQITATIGSCNATANVNVFVVPYPAVSLGPDTTICFSTSAQLHSVFQGTSFSWSPTSSLSNPSSPNPIATPINTTTYVMSVFDNAGCPKPGRDSITVIVLPKVKAFAGNDTAVVVGQPLHFNATGGVGYLWSPPTALSNPNIHNPVATYDGSFDQIRYRVLVTDALGCMDSAFMTVKVFNTFPQIFVPTAFTPNGDGRNDVIRPIAVGIKNIEYFRIYNRWGQMVFSTSINGHGWDGRIGGKEQSTATFVWIVSGTDYLDRHFFRKGTVTLIK
jgi:gliding motility-associated-like protein